MSAPTPPSGLAAFAAFAASRGGPAAAALAVLFLAACAGPSGDAQNLFDPRMPGALSAGQGAEFQRFGQSRRITPAMRNADAGAFRLGPGDRMEIEIEGKPETRAETFVTPDGRVYYHLAEGVPAAGRTISELQAALTEELLRYVKPPVVVRIGVTSVVSRDYSVMGAVVSPGVYPLNRPTTLLDAMAEAGGAYERTQDGNESFADLTGAYLVRRGQVMPVDFQALLRQGDMSQNIYVQPGDHIYIPSSESSSVYVLGAVRAPKSVGYTPTVTLVNAVAQAGGTTPTAYAEKIVIVRGSLGQPYVAVVNYADIIRGRATDVALAPGDVVWVAQSPYKLTERFVLRLVDSVARGSAASAGYLIVDPDGNSAAVGISD